MSATNGFQVGIEFDSVLAAISKQIYETPLAFIRENVQNAIDALRIQASRQSLPSSDESFRVSVSATPDACEISDNGVGMSLEDLRNLFWTIGASGKRTEEARDAGCVGMFGIGGFANFGVCDELRVTSQSASDPVGHWTELSRTDIESAQTSIPLVRSGESDDAAPRGTIVRGVLKAPFDVESMIAFVRDFVQYAEERVYFNGVLLSGQPLRLPSERGGDGLTPVSASAERWVNGSIEVSGQLFETPGHILQAEITQLSIAGEPVRGRAALRFENGPIDVLKRGFKICSTTIGTEIGVSGVIDCDRLSPTAGRDSLDSESSALLSSIVASMEHAAVLAVLKSPERIAQHSRIFRYVRRQSLIAQMGSVLVELADGSECSLADVQRRSQGDLRIFYASSKNRALSQLLQTRGHVVVQLPSDHEKQIAIRDYLTSLCGAEPFEGKIECSETYETMSLFERAFLSEVEQTITLTYDVTDLTLIPGKLTEDVPVYAMESPSKLLTIYVDVRHPEIHKLEQLGIGNGLFYSLAAAFVREYLGTSLRGRSPKFFGSGAVNLDFLAKRKSELWVLVTGDIEVLRQGTQRDVVRSSDIQIISIGGASGGAQVPTVSPQGRNPKLVRIEGIEEFAGMSGYYLRVPNSAADTYGDVIQQLEGRGAVWAGNKIMLIASDLISTAFQFEVRLDRLITTDAGGGVVAGGAEEIERPVQALFDGLYFPVPLPLEAFVVPTASSEVRIEVRCEWMDFTTSRAWELASDEVS